MFQEDQWNEEYASPKFLSLSEEPQAFVKKFFKWLDKVEGLNLKESKLIDIGCGNGRAVLWFEEKYGGRAIGVDFSDEALKIARNLALKKGFSGDNFIKMDISGPLSFSDGEFDIALAVNSMSTLLPDSRKGLISEIARILRRGGYLLVNDLVLDGDSNAKNLLKKFPGVDSNSYIVPETMMMEWVYKSETIKSMFEPFFEIVSLNKFKNYQKFSGGRIYKRRYITLYLKRK